MLPICVQIHSVSCLPIFKNKLMCCDCEGEMNRLGVAQLFMLLVYSSGTSHSGDISFQFILTVIRSTPITRSLLLKQLH